MSQATAGAVTDLHESDETAWLELMAALVAEGRWDEIDRANLSEYLSDMGKSERRKTGSRLRIILLHLLKWHHQPERRVSSWRETVYEQLDRFSELCDTATLRNHAAEVLADVYAKARLRAARETRLPLATFPRDCPYTVDGLLETLPDILLGEDSDPAEADS